MKNHAFAALLLLGLSIFFSSCQTPVATGLSSEDEAAIRAVLEKAMEIPEEDLTAYVNTYYATDATVLPPNMPAVTGQAAIVAAFKGLPAKEDFRAEILQIDGRDGLAYVRGTYSMNIRLPGAETPMHDSGKYIEIWKKQADGGWKVYIDIFNSDLPLPAPEIEQIK